MILKFQCFSDIRDADGMTQDNVEENHLLFQKEILRQDRITTYLSAAGNIILLISLLVAFITSRMSIHYYQLKYMRFSMSSALKRVSVLQVVSHHHF